MQTHSSSNIINNNSSTTTKTSYNLSSGNTTANIPMQKQNINFPNNLSAIPNMRDPLLVNSNTMNETAALGSALTPAPVAKRLNADEYISYDTESNDSSPRSNAVGNNSNNKIIISNQKSFPNTTNNNNNTNSSANFQLNNNTNNNNYNNNNNSTNIVFNPQNNFTSNKQMIKTEYASPQVDTRGNSLFNKLLY